jgi:hypothetical protein
MYYQTAAWNRGHEWFWVMGEGNVSGREDERFRMKRSYGRTSKTVEFQWVERRFQKGNFVQYGTREHGRLLEGSSKVMKS